MICEACGKNIVYHKTAACSKCYKELRERMQEGDAKQPETLVFGQFKKQEAEIKELQERLHAIIHLCVAGAASERILSEVKRIARGE